MYLNPKDETISSISNLDLDCRADIKILNWTQILRMMIAEGNF